MKEETVGPLTGTRRSLPNQKTRSGSGMMQFGLLWIAAPGVGRAVMDGAGRVEPESWDGPEDWDERTAGRLG